MADIGRLLSGLVKEASAVRPGGIRAYHSSPYDFERFDASKIGSGEGAQSYGYGHYFAENPAVSGRGGEYWTNFLSKFGPEEITAARYLEDAGFDREKAALRLRRSIADQDLPDANRLMPVWQGALSLIESGKPVGPRTYEVNINARPEQFLDWNKPVAQQASGVVDRLRAVWPRVEPSTSASWLAAKDASEAAKLSDAGIPGIKYLDQGSRGAGSGTSNYVVFPGNEHLIEIAKKYGLAGATTLGGGAAAATLAPGEAEAAPRLPLNWRAHTSVGRSEQATDAALAAIQDALAVGRPPNSGVPRIKPQEGPPPSTADVLATIADALKSKPAIAGLAAGGGAAAALTPGQAEAAPGPPRIGPPARMPGIYGDNVPRMSSSPATDLYSPSSVAGSYLSKHGGDAEAAVAQMEKVLRLSDPHPQTDALRQAIDLLRPLGQDLLPRGGPSGIDKLVGGGVLGAAALAPDQAEGAPPFRPPTPALPNQSMGTALANLAAGQEENQRNADALRVNTEPPALPPAPPRPQPPPSQMAPMPRNPAMPPPWAAQMAKNAFAPYSTSPDAYAPPPQPWMVPNDQGKLRQADPAIDPRWPGAAYDAANLAMWFMGPR